MTRDSLHTLLIRAWCLGQQRGHHPGVCWKCSVWGPIPPTYWIRKFILTRSPGGSWARQGLKSSVNTKWVRGPWGWGWRRGVGVLHLLSLLLLCAVPSAGWFVTLGCHQAPTHFPIPQCVHLSFCRWHWTTWTVVSVTAGDTCAWADPALPSLPALPCTCVSCCHGDWWLDIYSSFPREEHKTFHKNCM